MYNQAVSVTTKTTNCTNAHCIAVIQSCWHKEIVDQFVSSFKSCLAESSGRFDVDTFEVPGVVEIPLVAKKLIETGRFDVIVTTGLIVDHGVYRHDFVARSVMDSIMKLQMETGVPIIYGILTPQDFVSEGRAEFFKAHFPQKGREAAHACVQTVENLQKVEALSN
jgi:6,7-dimethyl-8-ribityllumazine synthase